MSSAIHTTGECTAYGVGSYLIAQGAMFVWPDAHVVVPIACALIAAGLPLVRDALKERRDRRARGDVQRAENYLAQAVVAAARIKELETDLKLARLEAVPGA